jgi:ABC-type uncharacterized transport system permease subunit
LTERLWTAPFLNPSDQFLFAASVKSIGGISSIIIVGQSVLSGMWFPITGLDKGMITFMKVLPFKNATALVQNVIVGVNDSFRDLTRPLLIVLGYTAVMFVAAILAFRRKMKAD